jgi:hypothetical protein
MVGSPLATAVAWLRAEQGDLYAGARVLVFAHESRASKN